MVIISASLLFPLSGYGMHTLLALANCWNKQCFMCICLRKVRLFQEVWLFNSLDSCLSERFILPQEVQKHSVHTLVFRSLKRTHDMFVSDHAKTIALDDDR